MISWIQQNLCETPWIDGRLFQEPDVYPSFAVVFQGSLVSPFTLHSCLRKMRGLCRNTNSLGNLLQSQNNAFIWGAEGKDRWLYFRDRTPSSDLCLKKEIGSPQNPKCSLASQSNQPYFPKFSTSKFKTTTTTKSVPKPSSEKTKPACEPFLYFDKNVCSWLSYAYGVRRKWEERKCWSKTGGCLHVWQLNVSAKHPGVSVMWQSLPGPMISWYSVFTWSQNPFKCDLMCQCDMSFFFFWTNVWQYDKNALQAGRK